MGVASISPLGWIFIAIIFGFTWVSIKLQSLNGIWLQLDKIESKIGSLESSLENYIESKSSEFIECLNTIADKLTDISESLDNMRDDFNDKAESHKEILAEAREDLNSIESDINSLLNKADSHPSKNAVADHELMELISSKTQLVVSAVATNAAELEHNLTAQYLSIERELNRIRDKLQTVGKQLDVYVEM